MASTPMSFATALGMTSSRALGSRKLKQTMMVSKRPSSRARSSTVEAVAGDADVADQAFLPGLAKGLERSARRDHRLVVGVGCRRSGTGRCRCNRAAAPAGWSPGRPACPPRRVLRHGLRGHDHPLVGLLQGQADAPLAGGVGPGGVDEVHSPLDGVADRLHRFRFAHPLDGDAPQCRGGIPPARSFPAPCVPRLAGHLSPLR